MDEQRNNRLEKNRERTRSARRNETDEERDIRLDKERDRSRCGRVNETEEQRDNRRVKNREQTQSGRANETEERRDSRRVKNRAQTRSGRANETEEQRLIRLEQQRRRSQANRVKKRLLKIPSGEFSVDQQATVTCSNETEDHLLRAMNSTDNLTRNEGTRKTKRSSSHSWPEPISHDVKKACLKEYLQRMSMSALAEVTCAACNVRTSVHKSKKMPVSKVPHMHLLKISSELKDLILNSRSTISQNFDHSSAQMTGQHQSNPITIEILMIRLNFKLF